MAQFNWDSFDKVNIGDTGENGSKFSWDAVPHEAQADPTKSPVTAASTATIQGAVPFASAFAGAGKAGLDAITGISGPLAGGSLGDIADDYRTARDSFSQDAKTSQAENPKTGLAFNLAGGLANPLFRSAKTLPEVASAGAVQGLGQSDADLTKPGNEVRALKDTAGGAAGGLAGYGLASAVPVVGNAVSSFGKKALTNLGPTGDAIAARLAGKAQDSARSYPELAEDMAGTLKNLKDQILEKSNDAKGTLSADAEIPKAMIADSVDRAVNNLGVKGADGNILVGKAAKAAHGTLSDLQKDIAALPDNISEQDIKKLIQTMDDNINWDDSSQRSLNTMLQGVRGGMDSTLKFRNLAYKAAMEPVSDRVGLLEDLKRMFNIQNSPGEGLVPSDTTASKIQSSLRENKAVTQDRLDQLNGFTDTDYAGLAKDYNLAKQFQVKSPQASSKKTNLGAAIGAGVGALLHGPAGAVAGGGLGAAAGGTADAYGGRIAAKLIDSYLKAGNSAAFGKFAPVIEQAASRGPEALGVVSSMLGSNPEFRAKMGL